jgi:protein ImuA
LSPGLPVFPSARAIIWCDPAHELYPPALAAYGFPLDQLLLLHPTASDPQGKEMIWAATECLRCKGIGAVVASPGRLSRIEARRLQLAAEQGGGVGLLLRHLGRDSAHHAAASRWLVRPAPGARTMQRWTIELLHGHGGRIGQTLCLELCRETNHLRTFDPVADRQAEAITRAS